MGPALPNRRNRKRSLIAAAAAAAIAAGGFAITTTTASAQAEGCEVDYNVVNDWGGGFQANVTITAGEAINGWNLSWNFPSGTTVSSAWNVDWSQSGATFTGSDVGWNGFIGAGQSVEVFGFIGNGSSATPGQFTINGDVCDGQIDPPTDDPTTDEPTTEEPTDDPTDPGGGNEWNPPANLVQPLNEVWAHVEDTYNLNFQNFGWDQVMDTGGKINYCVRWDSQNSVSASLRDSIEAKVQEQYQLWFDQMVGWNDWPFQEIEVNVVGWAAYDRNLLQWNDDSVDIYIGNIREDAPQCGTECGRFFHQDNQYPACAGGYDHHYDQSLWLTQGMGGGAGGDWGQRMGQEYFVNALNSAQILIYLHELGHTFGLDDFYDWTPTGQCCFIMKAGSSSVITEFDEWMLRDWWRHLKSRYGL